MWNRIENILSSFKDIFSRKAAYQWFVTIVAGIMVRTDKLGITSVIRSLFLRPDTYELMIKFFRASSWSLPEVRGRWQDIVAGQASLFRINGRAALVGDGVKQPKEGRRMPGVKRMAQESETQTKPDMIHGQMWGCIGILAGDCEKLACVPVSMRIHDGLQAVHKWENPQDGCPSHVVQMIRDGCSAAQHFGDSYLLMDRYFLSVDALKELDRQNKGNSAHVHMITKAKCSAVAYGPAPARKPGQKGRPCKKGGKVKLMDMFRDRQQEFRTAEAIMYGKKQAVSYYCVDLLWGQGLYKKLRFVLVEYNGTKNILVSTDLTLDPVEIIEAYCRRFRIETTFREFKQQIGGMAYHFWTKAMPRLSHFRKKTDPEPLETVVRDSDRKKVQKAVRATEMYAMISCIAMGIIQILSIDTECAIPANGMRYQRTPAKAKPSEANIMDYLRRHIFQFMYLQPQNEITQLIQSLQIDWDNEKSKKSA